MSDTNVMPKDIDEFNKIRHAMYLNGIHEGRRRERHHYAEMLAKFAGDQFVWGNKEVAEAFKGFANNARNCEVKRDEE